ncbi:hypothetical protein V466_25090 [Pseudomonas mandelii PD30]|uniref:SMP-30/Gluconolactonase/LRE-like region domain-containing protein n=1 Tax=Pseudomonas mandelii PD30 TaxID=1419583 RepID=A0A059KVX3_9PSED|nr:SMP-30/gluconolactonase/LRE family protein [Pseudomonas mandelii]KDD66223.1 hypothetical protein V466_25090 [Pseudomonas mandelii PD30]
MFAHTPPDLGRPDGLAMDAEGGIRVCQFIGGCLLRYDRHGELTQTIEIPFRFSRSEKQSHFVA